MDFHEGLTVIKKNGKYGYIDKSGEIKIPLKFTFAESFSEGLAFVKYNGKYGFINKNGNVVFNTNYQQVDYYFDNGVTRVSKSYDNYHYIDKTGRELTDSETKDYIALIEQTKYEKFGPYSKRDLSSGKYGFVNLKGDFVIDPIYESSYDGFEEGFAAVKINGKWGFINKNGEFIIKAQYDVLKNFSDSLAYFEIGNNSGFIDKTGKRILNNLKYDYGWFFDDGLLLVSIHGKDKHGYIDKTGKVVIPIIHNYFNW